VSASIAKSLKGLRKKGLMKKGMVDDVVVGWVRCGGVDVVVGGLCVWDFWEIVLFWSEHARMTLSDGGKLGGWDFGILPCFWVLFFACE